MKAIDLEGTVATGRDYLVSRLAKRLRLRMIAPMGEAVVVAAFGASELDCGTGARGAGLSRDCEQAGGDSGGDAGGICDFLSLRRAAAKLGHRVPTLGRCSDSVESTGRETNGRRAKFYALTPPGRAQLAKEKRNWQKVFTAMSQALGEEV